jgi:hypothetical protein
VKKLFFTAPVKVQQGSSRFIIRSPYQSIQNQRTDTRKTPFRETMIRILNFPPSVHGNFVQAIKAPDIIILRSVLLMSYRAHDYYVRTDEIPSIFFRFLDDHQGYKMESQNSDTSESETEGTSMRGECVYGVTEVLSTHCVGERDPEWQQRVFIITPERLVLFRFILFSLSFSFRT